MIRRLAIVGLGLLGGSVAKAARAESLAREIVGIGRNPASLAPALSEGAVDRVTTDLREGLPEERDLEQLRRVSQAVDDEHLVAVESPVELRNRMRIDQRCEARSHAPRCHE